MAKRSKKRRSAVTTARKGRGRRRTSAMNPLFDFSEEEAEIFRKYRPPASEAKKKRAQKMGLEEPKEGRDVLRKLGERILAVHRGEQTPVWRSRKTGKKAGEQAWVFPTKKGAKFVPSGSKRTHVSRSELRGLDTFIQRHPGALPADTVRTIQRRIKRRHTRRDGSARLWYNFVDSTEATKFEREKDESGEGIGEAFAASYAPPQTCPTDCAMRGGKAGTEGGDDPQSRLCYAGEHNTLQQWKSLWKGYAGLPWKAYLEKIRRSPSKIVRLNVAGDLPYDESDCSRRHLDRKKVLELADAAAANGRTAFTYTHFDPTYRDNGAIVKEAIKRGLKINLSADNLSDADKKVDMGFDVAVVLPHIRYQERQPIVDDAGKLVDLGEKTGRTLSIAQGHGITTPAGRKIFFCPNITTTAMKREMKTRAKRLEKRIGHKPNIASLTAVAARAYSSSKIASSGKTCATCSPKSFREVYDTKLGKMVKEVAEYQPECAVMGRKRIIGFLAHGSAGSLKNLDPVRASELFYAPAITPVAVHELTEALARADVLQQREAFKEAAKRAEEGKKTIGATGRALAVAKRTNPRRRNMTPTRASAHRARLERLAQLAKLMPSSTYRSQARRVK